MPLLAYALPLPAVDRFAWATGLTLLTLFGVGAARTYVTFRRWWWSGMEMLAVGAVAAAVAYVVGAIIASIVAVNVI